MARHEGRNWLSVILLFLTLWGVGECSTKIYTGPTTPGLNHRRTTVMKKSTPGLKVVSTPAAVPAKVTTPMSKAPPIRPSTLSRTSASTTTTTRSQPTPPTPRPIPHVTNIPGDGGNLTGSNICQREVTRSESSFDWTTFACHRTIVVRCSECLADLIVNCNYINNTYCERKDAGSCTAKVFAYRPVTVTVWECCNGFEQIGNECKLIKACENGNGGCRQLCRKNSNLGLYCECFDGFILNGTTACTDWDECRASNGGCSDECTNTMGSFYCTCPSGYKLKSPTLCEEVDECKLYNGGCAQKCINTVGRHYCECSAGFELTDGKECKDIDECSDEFRCGHKCHNFIGSYLCSCPEGETLRPDNRSCTGVQIANTAQRSHKDVITSVPMIATLSSVGALVIIVLLIWVICCYLKGPCWCCASNSNADPKPRVHRDESIVMQYRGTEEGKSPPSYYNNGYVSGGSDDSDYNTNARRPNGLPDKEVIMEDDIHILGD